MKVLSAVRDTLFKAESWLATSMFLMVSGAFEKVYGATSTGADEVINDLTSLGENVNKGAGTFLKLFAIVIYFMVLIGVPLFTLFQAKKKAQQSGADNPWLSAAIWAGVAFFVSIIVIVLIDKQLTDAGFGALAPSKILASAVGK